MSEGSFRLNSTIWINLCRQLCLEPYDRDSLLQLVRARRLIVLLFYSLG